MVVKKQNLLDLSISCTNCSCNRLQSVCMEYNSPFQTVLQAVEQSGDLPTEEFEALSPSWSILACLCFIWVLSSISCHWWWTCRHTWDAHFLCPAVKDNYRAADGKGGKVLMEENVLMSDNSPTQNPTVSNHEEKALQVCAIPWCVQQLS